jgi:glycosyltransferase involved in cell wall biosynthesis
MKLLLVGAVFRPEWTGGEPWTARALADGFRGRGHEVVTLEGLHDRISFAALASSPFDWDLVRVNAYARQIRAIAPDVVVGFYDYDSSLCRAATREGRPLVSVVHIYWPLCPIGTLYIEGMGICTGPGLTKCLRHMSLGVPNSRLPLNLHSLPPPLGLQAYAKLRGRFGIQRQSQRIVVLSQKMFELMSSAGYERIAIVPSGIDISEFSAREWPTARPKNVFLPSTSQSERKGTQHFQLLAQRVRAHRSDARFVATNFQGSDPNVDGTPFLSRRQLLEEYAKAYCVVAPVLWDEPFGLVAVEAMATGRPVVAYDAGAMPELIEDGVTGLVVPRGDVNSMQAAVERLLDDETLARRLGRAARRRVEERYTLSKMVDGYLAVLLDAAASGGARGSEPSDTNIRAGHRSSGD